MMVRPASATLFVPRAGRLPPGLGAGPLVVLSPGPIPTTDFYLTANLAGHCPQRAVQVLDTRRSAAGDGFPAQAAAVFIVRHAPPAWLRWLLAERARCGRVIYLLDDDIPAVLQATELPAGYRLRTWWRHARMHTLLAALCDAVWVSTPELARRHAAALPELCEPCYLPAPVPRSDDGVDRGAPPSYCYHGTRAHRREIEWLVPVVREVQAVYPEARFEIFGDWRVHRLYRGIPGVTVRAPMTWPEYLAYSSTVRHQLGLAPCLDTPFNRARAHVKLFDITRLGAAGIYSDAVPYAWHVRHRDTGWLVANRRRDWVQAILQALRDPPACRALHARALRRCSEERGAFPAL
ncbi:MAG: hypothetical protein CALGDGBN_01194 [Pseudomonadales bacterium]|nr:hypothetical protein [Pseudomonadales bacterium]